MDPATAVALLALQPLTLDRHGVVLAGAFCPVPIPWEGVPQATRTAWVLTDPTVPVELRVQTALDAGRPDTAWAIIIAQGRPALGLLERPLAAWTARELARLRLPAPTGPVLVVAPDAAKTQRLDTVVNDILRDLPESLPLSWPCWYGPLMVVSPDAVVDPAPGQSRLVRPVLPVLRLDAQDVGGCAAAVAVLALDLAAPPPGGWPAWLRTGVAELARLHAVNQGLGPLRARSMRRQAGAGAVRNLFLASDPDPALAAAVCLPLTNPSRRQAFASLLDVLRNGGSAIGAVELAYGWNVERMIDAR
jgi:hypothetical protein